MVNFWIHKLLHRFTIDRGGFKSNLIEIIYNYSIINDWIFTMNLLEFTDQVELQNVLATYINTYSQRNPNIIKDRPIIDDFRVLRSADDDYGVCFSLETALIGTYEAVAKEGIIGKNIERAIVSSIAYFLVQGTSPTTVPNNLRIGLAINHNHAHWTGLVVNLHGLRECYEKIYAFCKTQNMHFDGKFTSEIKECNRARNAIYEYFGIILDHPTNKSLITPEEKKALTVLQNFKFNMASYDSMNDGYYYKNAKKSLEFVSNYGLLDDSAIGKVQCSQQMGNTCGDHTIFNLFVSSIIKPRLLNPNSSEDLRALTNAVGKNPGVILNATKANALATTFIDTLSNTMQEAELLDLKELSSSFEMAIELMTDSIFAKHEGNAFELLNAALSGKGYKSVLDELEHSEDDKVKEQLKLVDQLEKIMRGEALPDDKAFKNITPINYPIYGTLAQCLVREICVENDSLKARQVKNQSDSKSAARQFQLFNHNQSINSFVDSIKKNVQATIDKLTAESELPKDKKSWTTLGITISQISLAAQKKSDIQFLNTLLDALNTQLSPDTDKVLCDLYRSYNYPAGFEYHANFTLPILNRLSYNDLDNNFKAYLSETTQSLRDKMGNIKIENFWNTLSSVEKNALRDMYIKTLPPLEFKFQKVTL